MRRLFPLLVAALAVGALTASPALADRGHRRHRHHHGHGHHGYHGYRGGGVYYPRYVGAPFSSYYTGDYGYYGRPTYIHPRRGVQVYDAYAPAPIPAGPGPVFPYSPRPAYYGCGGVQVHGRWGGVIINF